MFVRFCLSRLPALEDDPEAWGVGYVDVLVRVREESIRRRWFSTSSGNEMLGIVAR